LHFHLGLNGVPKEFACFDGVGWRNRTQGMWNEADAATDCSVVVVIDKRHHYPKYIAEMRRVGMLG
jgi:hypothetical protein